MPCNDAQAKFSSQMKRRQFGNTLFLNDSDEKPKTEQNRNTKLTKKAKSILVHLVLSFNTVETNKTGAFRPFRWENRLMIAAAAGAGRVSPSSNPSAHPSPHPQRWPRWRRVTASSGRPLPHQTPRAKPPASSPRSTSLSSVYVTSLLKKTYYRLNRITLPSKDTSL